MNIFWDEQSVCASCENGGNYANATTSPEANGYGDLHPMRFQQATWTSPVNNKLLLEGGFGYFFSRWGGRAKEDPNTENLVRIIEQCAGGLRGQRRHPQPDVPLADDRPVQRRPEQEHHHHVARQRARTSPARSSFKFGYIGNQLGDIRSANRGANDLRYRVNNGVPNQLTQYVHNQQNDLWMRNHALLRAAAVDARPADAAGRAAIRSRVELGAGAAARDAVLGRSRSCSTRRRWWTATTT